MQQLSEEDHVPSTYETGKRIVPLFNLNWFLHATPLQRSLFIFGLLLTGDLFLYLAQHIPLLFFLILLLSVGIGLSWLRTHIANTQTGDRSYVEVTAQREETYSNNGPFTHIHTLDDIRQLTPATFERLVAQLLTFQGYTQVTVTGGSGDLCVDIKAISPQNQVVVVQCKRYNAKKKVSSKEVQQFIGMMHVQHRAERGLYITTSSYTSYAEVMQKNERIELIDGKALLMMIETVKATC